MRGKLFEILVAACLVAVLGLILWQWRECSDRGGELVRGVVWFVCVTR